MHTDRGGHGPSELVSVRTPITKPELSLKQDKSAGIRTPRSNMKQST